MYRCARTRGGLKGCLLASSIWVFTAAWAAPAVSASSSIAIDVPAGSLDGALAAYAGQTKQQVLYTADLVAHRQAPAVKGAYTPEEALRRLLDGTGITAKRTAPNVLVLQSRGQRAPAPASRPFGAEAAPEAIATVDPGQASALPHTAPAVVEEVTVTGSHLRGAPPASPLLVIDRSQLLRSGQTTLADALRVLPQNFGGGASETTNLTAADGVGRNTGNGSALNLRGLGNGATLVLINGHRVAGSGTFADFVDVSTIPTTAVERVEVLLDGASAVYRP